MNPDPDNAPSPAELLEEDLEPIPWYLVTPESPLRYRCVSRRRNYYHLTCELHPEFTTVGNRAWVVRYGIFHALRVHGVALPPRTQPDTIEPSTTKGPTVRTFTEQDERDMQRMEAEADRAETLRDEQAKADFKASVEG